MKGRAKVFFIVLLLLGALVFTVAVMSGSVRIKAGEIFLFLTGHGNGTENRLIIMDIRLPRIMYAVLVGGMLGMAGAMLQSSLKNPLADPYITGIASGAALGASVSIIAGFPSVMLPAMAGAVLTLFFVYRVSLIYGRMNTTALLLVGVMTGSFLSAVIMLLNALYSKDMVKIVFWLMGDLSNINTSYMLPGLIVIIFVFASGMFFARDLDIVAAGEEEAETLGVNTGFIRMIYFVLAGLLTAAAVSVSGIIGFVGLIIPHIVRRFTGPGMRVVLPASFLGGGVFLLAADTLARTAVLPSEIPAGIVTGLIGAPVFVGMLVNRGRK